MSFTDSLDTMVATMGQYVSAIVLIVGFIKLLVYIYYSSSFLKKHLLTKPLDLVDRYDGKNTWALITGSSDGIGLGMAKRFAKQGFNIIQVSRNVQKMKKAEEEIKAANPKIKTMIVEADFKGANNVHFYRQVLD